MKTLSRGKLGLVSKGLGEVGWVYNHHLSDQVLLLAEGTRCRNEQWGFVWVNCPMNRVCFNAGISLQSRSSG